MGNQAGSGMVAGTPAAAGGASGDELAQAQAGGAASHVHHAFHGRAVSWVAVSLILAGFVCGGLSLVFATWPTFYAGVGLVVIGGLLAMSTNIFEDWY